MNKKVALITGASTGIGKELAYIHAEKGGDLVIVARSQDKLEALKKEIESKHNVQVMIIAKDLSKPEIAPNSDSVAPGIRLVTVMFVL